jgi:hypothetical protein
MGRNRRSNTCELYQLFSILTFSSFLRQGLYPTLIIAVLELNRPTIDGDFNTQSVTADSLLFQARHHKATILPQSTAEAELGYELTRASIDTPQRV